MAFLYVVYAIVVVAVACEARWRLRPLRVLLLVYAIADIMSATLVERAARRAVQHPHRVVTPALLAGQPPTVESEFNSGVTVMAREVRRDLNGIYFPLGVLVWLALFPAMLGPAEMRKEPPDAETPV